LMTCVQCAHGGNKCAWPIDVRQDLRNFHL
jgi:hypothetical protein